jgi:hypothetical protein
MKKQSGVHLEVKLTASTMGARKRQDTPVRSREGATGSALWKVLLVLGSLWASPFIFRLSMELRWAHAASTGMASGPSMKGQQRTQLEPMR